MTAGNMYTIAGSPTGNFGRSQDGTPASQSLLLRPANMAVDPSGNLFIADTGNNRVVEIAKVSGQNRGNGTMTVNDMYTIAGNPGGSAGHTGDGLTADAGNNRVQEIPATGGTQWNQSMTAWDMYTVAGDVTGSAGRSGNGTALGSSLLTTPEGSAPARPGTCTSRHRQQPDRGGGQQGRQPVGHHDDRQRSVHGRGGRERDRRDVGEPGPGHRGIPERPDVGVCANSTQLYIADTGNNRIQEVATPTTRSGATTCSRTTFTPSPAPRAGGSPATAAPPPRRC